MKQELLFLNLFIPLYSLPLCSDLAKYGVTNKKGVWKKISFVSKEKMGHILWRAKNKIKQNLFQRNYSDNISFKWGTGKILTNKSLEDFVPRFLWKYS